MKNLLFVVAIVALAGSATGESVVYPYRYDPADHPDYALRHYQAPTWESVGGRIHADGVFYLEMNKITRIAGIDKNSFPANLDLDEYHAEINGWREEYGSRYAGRQIGESDAGFIHFNQSYEFPFSRRRENHYLSFADYFDSYGRLTDYQVYWGINMGLAHAAYAQGYVNVGNHQTHHPQYYQIINAFLRGAAKQYGTMLQGGLTDTYQKSSEAFRKKNMDAYEKAKQKLANMDPEDVTWKDKFDVKATLRRANEALDPDGSPFSYSYRYWYIGYQYNLSDFRHLEGLTFRDSRKKKEERDLTELGELHRHYEEKFLPTHPDPGGMVAPVAIMTDFFNGWVGYDNSASHRHLEGIAWDGVPFDRADYQLGNLLQLAYPDYLPNTCRKADLHVTEGGFSHTPFGDCVEVIQSDARTELLEQYGLIVLAGEFRTELQLVRAKLEAYLKQGGQVFLCAEQFKSIWPERPPVHGAKVVEIAVGNGTLAVSPTPYGLRKVDKPTDGNHTLQLQEHVQTYLRKKMESLKLFSVGDNLAYIVNRSANGIYTLGIYNGRYKPLPFSIQSHIGKIVEMKETPTGDVNIIKADARFYAPRAIKAGSWGSSDATTIGGGEARLFEIKVDERNVRVLKKVDYPARPKRYLAMGMKNLRRNIQLRPSFFQQYSGVTVDVQDLLSTDDAALKYEHGWYRVRHLEILTNAQKPTDELKHKMTLLPFARFQGSEKVDGTFPRSGKSFPTIEKAKPGKPYLAVRGIDDLFQWLEKHPVFFSHFSGVMLESDYLFQRSSNAWRKEADMLKQHGIGVVVDFSGRVKMYRDISFQPTMPLAQTGLNMYANVLQKMQDTSIHDAVFASPKTWDKHTEKALETFATMAAEDEVNLHLRCIRASEKTSRLDKVLTKMKKPNLHIALNPLVESKREPESQVRILLPATIGELGELLPMHRCKAERPKADSEQLVVFDAEYLNGEEIQRDIAWWN